MERSRRLQRCSACGLLLVTAVPRGPRLWCRSSPRTPPARTPGQVIEEGKVLAAQVDAFLVRIRDTEAALGIPALRDGEQAFNDALAAEQRRWDEGERELQQKELEAEREA